MITAFPLVAGMVALPARRQADALNPLAQASAAWSLDWQNRDLDAVLPLYTEDAVFMDADGSHVAGKSALRKFFAKVLKRYSAQPSLHGIDNASSGNLGYDWGDYTEIVTPVGKPANAIRTSGTYLVILKKIAARWPIAERRWTGNVPVPEIEGVDPWPTASRDFQKTSSPFSAS